MTKRLSLKLRKKTKLGREHRERKEKLQELTQTAHETRRAFVRNFVPEKTQYSKISEITARVLLKNDFCCDFKAACENFLLLEKSNVEHSALDRMVSDTPERILFVAAYLVMQDSKHCCYFDYFGTYKDDERLNDVYYILETMGYILSDDERKLQDGTHELYAPDDPCYICKLRRHDHCEDKCCEKCRESKESCNGAQLCEVKLRAEAEVQNEK